MAGPEPLVTDWSSLLVPQRRASRIATSLNRQGIDSFSRRPRGSSGKHSDPDRTKKAVKSKTVVVKEVPQTQSGQMAESEGIIFDEPSIDTVTIFSFAEFAARIGAPFLR